MFDLLGPRYSDARTVPRDPGKPVPRENPKAVATSYTCWEKSAVRREMVKFSPGTMMDGAWRPTMIAEVVEKRVKAERRPVAAVDVKCILIFGVGNWMRMSFGEADVLSCTEAFFGNCFCRWYFFS